MTIILDRPAVDELTKRESTLAARVALWGGTLTRIESDFGLPLWVVTRWSLTRAFSSLGDIEAFLRLVGAR